MSIVMAISKGADDFVCKPFDLNVLAAKITAIDVYKRQPHRIVDRIDLLQKSKNQLYF